MRTVDNNHNDNCDDDDYDDDENTNLAAPWSGRISDLFLAGVAVDEDSELDAVKLSVPVSPCPLSWTAPALFTPDGGLPLRKGHRGTKVTQCTHTRSSFKIKSDNIRNYNFEMLDLWYMASTHTHTQTLSLSPKVHGVGGTVTGQITTGGDSYKTKKKRGGGRGDNNQTISSGRGP